MEGSLLKTNQLRRCCIALLSSLVVCVKLGSQCPATEQRGHSNVLPLRVITKNDRKPVDNLLPRNLVVTLNGAPQTVCALLHSRTPTSLGILFDVSGSMAHRQDGAFRLSVDAVQQILKASAPGDEYFLQYISESPTPAVFTSDLQQIRAGLAIKPKGKTALLDSLYMALTTMQKARNLDRALLIVSDGLDNRSKHKFKDIQSLYAKTPVPIFFLIPMEMMPPHSPGVSPDQLDARSELIKLASQSGGYPVAAQGSRQVSEVIDTLIPAIFNPYLLFLPSNLASTPTPELQVKVVGVPSSPLAFFRAIELVHVN
jgi:hypothetical protein